MAHLYLSEHIRQHILDNLGVNRLPDYLTLVKDETPIEFFILMTNRLIMGRIRYKNSIKTKTREKNNYIKAVKQRIELYEKEGNQEHLIDAANYLLLEYLFGNHPKRHMKASDDRKDTHYVG